jgi:predicted PurR-regulated permease PerM
MPTAPSAKTDLTRTLLLVLAFTAMVGGSLYVLRPFLLPLVWATILVVATWPGFLGLERRLSGRRRFAVGIAATVMLVVIVVPVLLAVVTIAKHADEIAAFAREARAFHVPAAPPWALEGPLASMGLGERWNQAHAASPAEIQAILVPRLRGVASWFAREIGSVGVLLLDFFLMTVFAGVLFTHGERAVLEVRRFRSPPRRRTWRRGDPARR